MSGKTAEKLPKASGKPFQKGDDPRRNTEGRPVGSRNFKTIYQEAMKKLAHLNDVKPEDLEVQIAQTGIANAMKGDYKFYKDLQDRIHGQPTKHLDHTTKGEKIRTATVKFVKFDGSQRK